MSVFVLSTSTGVNSFCRLIKPSTTALSGVLEITSPFAFADFPIKDAMYVTALQPNLVANARSKGEGKPP